MTSFYFVSDKFSLVNIIQKFKLEIANENLSETRRRRFKWLKF